MKLCFYLLVFALASRVDADSNFTNYVEVKPGLFLTLVQGGPMAEGNEFLHPSRLEARKDLLLVLHNNSVVDNALFLLSDAYSLSFQLYDSSLKLVPKTGVGVSNSVVPAAGPQGIKGIKVNHLSPGGVSVVRDFGPLQDYFRVPRDGEYVLELRLRYCFLTNGQYGWKYSPRIRMPVMINLQ